MLQEEIDKILRSHLLQLGEHFDAVRIFVSKYDPETEITSVDTVGFGNHFTQRGMIDDWTRDQQTILKGNNDDET